MNLKKNILIGVSALLALECTSAVPYVFTKIDELSSTALGSYSALYPSISENGVVVFTRTLDGTSNPAVGVFRSEMGVNTQLVHTAQSADHRDVGEPAISSDGTTICFAGKDDLDTVGVFPPVTTPEYHGNVTRVLNGTATILKRSDPYPRFSGVFIDEFPQINGVAPAAASGAKVCFTVRLSEKDLTPFSSAKRRLYYNDNGTETLLLQDATPRPTSTGVAAPGFKLATSNWNFAGMNNAGTVAFRADHPYIGSVAQGQGIYTVSVGAGVQTIMEPSVAYLPFTTFSNFVPYSIDDAGRVLIYSSYFYNEPGKPTRSSSGLFLKASGQAPVELAPGSSFFFSRGALSPAGRLAFRAQAFPPSGSAFTGIFTGPDILADRVIRNGDTLFGGMVSDLNIQSRSINDRGQIAFYYRLSSGAVGIAVATPVPELQYAQNAAANTITLTWPQHAPTSPHDFKAYRSTNLTSWTSQQSQTTVSAGIHTLIVPMTEPREFFRLAP